MHVLTVVGARPQFIKASVVSRALITSGMTETLVHTGQHYDDNMSQVFFDELEISTPDVNLGVHESSHAAMTAAMLVGIEREILEREPTAVLVYGDTNSTLAGALAASKLHVPVAHVEAGLRSFNRLMPEEQNRVVTDHLSDLLLTPTTTATQNLAAEGITGDRVVQVGDVMFDAALHFGELAERQGLGIIAELDLIDEPFILTTVHRAENTDDPQRLQVIMDALDELATEIQVVMPLHPRTRPVISTNDHPLLTFINPVGYLDMVRLERSAALICTDSGGVQKEAYFHRVPCVTLRDETEWTELVDMGWNQLAPPISKRTVVETARTALSSRPGVSASPYGDGRAAELVAGALTRLRQDSGGKH